ncbi:MULTISPECIES: pilus assembly protein TadG-related protein [unclassified Methylobacterium]|uniref:TadE/TadG family type IV pilus assembly protein n=2 Tax=Methylobacterium TaxID=407 RepID=UPI0022699FED|nr:MULTISPECIES: pilus assembly protein TadG-related protein [unclassified Methylobacterium]
MIRANLLNRFGRDASASTAVFFAFCAIPMIGIVGIGIDYYTALANKARLDAAADAAAIAGITAAQQYISANSSSQIDPGLTSNAISAGQTQAGKAFYANAGKAKTLVNAVASAVVARSGQTLTASVNYTGTQATAFGKLFRVPTFSLAGHSGSSLTMGSYLDFYLALDMSGSMGLPTSTAGQQQLMAINPDDRSQYPGGCQFACHFSGFQGYGVAKNNNITLRVDSVGKAVQNLIQTANITQTLKNQYRIGIYTFIVNVMQAAALSSNFAAATTVAGQLGATYLDTGLANAATQVMGSGGTHFENVFPGVQQYAQTFGDGSSPTKPKAFLFIVTDGADNNQTYDGNGNWTGSQPQRPNNFQYCQTAQQQGVTVAILYVPYQPIYNPNSSFAGDEDGKVNTVIPNIPGDLQACASPGYFFTANSDTDINNAMQTMFAQALRAARITQ